MRVLHVITGLGVGGAELQLRFLLRHSRHEPEVISLYNPGPVAEMIAADGVPVRDMGMARNTQVGTLWRLRREIRAGRYDVVHAHLYRSQVYGRLAAYLARTPVIVSTEHSIGETHLERRRMTLGVRSLYLASGLVSPMTIAVSDAVRVRMERWGVPAHKIVVIPNGTDFDRVAFDPPAGAAIRAEFGLPADATVTGLLGRLDPTKRFDLVIESAAPLLGDQRRLLIVGDGSERARLEDLARQHGVADYVTFTGERHDVAAMLSAMDLFVCSSAQETFGLSVLEAMANWLPVLYTTCPALDGIVTSRARRVAGKVPAMRAAIAEALDGGRPARADEPAIRALYGMQSVAAQVDEVYERLMARHHGRPSARQPAAIGPARGEAGGPR